MSSCPHHACCPSSPLPQRRMTVARITNPQFQQNGLGGIWPATVVVTLCALQIVRIMVKLMFTTIDWRASATGLRSKTAAGRVAIPAADGTRRSTMKVS